MDIISRSEAKARGLARYFTGKPCKHGHLSERSVSGTCMACERVAKAEAYKKNPESFKARALNRYRLTSNRQPKTRMPEDERRSRMQAAVRKHYANNREYYAERCVMKRAQKMRAVPSWFGELDRLVMSEAGRLVSMRNRSTGVHWHIDHMIPLAGETVCGFHAASNIQVIPARLNRAKGNKLIFTNRGEWIAALQERTS